MYSLLCSAVEQGLIFSILALGLFISFRILNIPDLTVDGSFVTGCAVSAVFAEMGHPFLGIIVAVLSGAFAGMLTGLLHTVLKIQPILAGILTMTALYTVNLRIMGKKPNIAFSKDDTIFAPFSFIDKDYRYIAVTLAIVAILCTAIYFFFKTQLGMSLRATGDNESMVRASSINSKAMIVLGIAVANAFVALSGAVLTQQQNFGDVTTGTGMMVVGLASIIIGDTIFGKSSVLRGIIAAVTGSVVYRLILALAYKVGMETVDVKLFSAVIVIVAISIPYLRKLFGKFSKTKVKKDAEG